MSTKPLCACLCALMLMTGCAQVDELLYGGSKPAAPAAADDANASADAIHINPEAARAFFESLSSPEALSLFADFGFAPAPGR